MSDPLIVIDVEGYDATIQHQIFPGAIEVVDLGPNPTWPSPREANDLIVDGVRKVLDEAWYLATGERLDRT